jgi:hypothetical protein
LLKSNTLGLPNLVEADNKTHSVKEILKTFFALSNSSCLMVKNYKDKRTIEKEIKNYPGFSIEYLEKKKIVFISARHVPYWRTVRWCYDTDVQRKLKLTKQVIQAGDSLFIIKLEPANKTTRLRKGISKEQFVNEVYKENSEYIIVNESGYEAGKLCKPHLISLGFKKVITFPITKLVPPNLNEYYHEKEDLVTIYAKE